MLRYICKYFLIVGMINDQSMFTRAQAQAQTFYQFNVWTFFRQDPFVLFISSVNDDFGLKITINL